jgi:hypothetical protein
MKRKIRVSLAFGNLSDGDLIIFANKVHTDMYSHSVFSGAPVPAADLQTGITAFNTAKVAQANGGKLATAEKNQRRDELIEMLEDLALYAKIASNNDLATLLSSGFLATNSNRTPTVLPKAVVLRITQNHTGVALVTVKAERNGKTYEVQWAEVAENGTPGPFGPTVPSTSSRNIPVPGLTPGKMYVFRVRVFGGKSEMSDWSDPVGQRVM